MNLYVPLQVIRWLLVIVFRNYLCTLYKTSFDSKGSIERKEEKKTEGWILPFTKRWTRTLFSGWVYRYYNMPTLTWKNRMNYVEFVNIHLLESIYSKWVVGFVIFFFFFQFWCVRRSLSNLKSKNSVLSCNFV